MIKNEYLIIFENNHYSTIMIQSFLNLGFRTSTLVKVMIQMTKMIHQPIFEQPTIKPG